MGAETPDMRISAKMKVLAAFLVATPAMGAELVFDGGGIVQAPGIVFESDGVRLAVPGTRLTGVAPVMGDNGAGLSFAMAAMDSASLADLTDGWGVRPLDVWVCGIRLAQPAAWSLIDGGGAVLPVADAGLAADLAAALSGEAPCPLPRR